MAATPAARALLLRVARVERAERRESRLSSMVFPFRADFRQPRRDFDSQTVVLSALRVNECIDGTITDSHGATHCCMRLFVAVDLPPDVVEKIAALPRPPLRTVRWTTPEQWHTTVRFLGEVDAGLLDEPAGLVAALDSVPILLRQRGIGPVEAVLGPVAGWFPGRRVLQIPVEGLDALAAVVVSATAAWGQPPERSFRGHLTLARARGQARGPGSLAGAAVSARWMVRELVLYSSAAGPSGSRYQVVYRVPVPS